LLAIIDPPLQYTVQTSRIKPLDKLTV